MYRYLRLSVLSLALIGPIYLTSCGPKATQANVPGSLNNTDALIYQQMQAAQAGIEEAKKGITQFPQLKDALNKVIASYNTTETSYQAYHKVGSGDLQGLKDQVATLMINLAQLQAAMGAKK